VKKSHNINYYYGYKDKKDTNCKKIFHKMNIFVVMLLFLTEAKFSGGKHEISG